MVDEVEIQELIKDINTEFHVKLHWHKRLRIERYRNDVTFHTFLPGGDSEITDDLRRQVRQFAENRGWLVSKQQQYTCLAPMIPVSVDLAFHATRRVSVQSIQEQGLLPSNSERQTSQGRDDCEGNIYVCQQLGSPADAGVCGRLSAHWWRAHFAENNRFSDRDWVILQVSLNSLTGARMYKDMWSESGIVVRNVDRIPPPLPIVYPAEGRR